MLRKSDIQKPAAAKAPAPKPEPAPPPAPTPPPAPQLLLSDRLESALLAVLERQDETLRAVLESTRKPKQLRGQVIRDKNGRASELIVTVTERE